MWSVRKSLEYVGDLEAAALHTENSTGRLAEKMFTNGPTYTHVAVLYESMVIASYLQKEPPKVPVVADLSERRNHRE